MKVLEIRNIEDCLDGSFIREVVFDEEITKEFIMSLKQRGKLQYFHSFAKPFFKLEANNDYICKGVEGEKSVRLIITSGTEETVNCFKEHVNEFQN